MHLSNHRIDWSSAKQDRNCPCAKNLGKESKFVSSSLFLVFSLGYTTSGRMKQWINFLPVLLRSLVLSLNCFLVRITSSSCGCFNIQSYLCYSFSFHFIPHLHLMVQFEEENFVLRRPLHFPSKPTRRRQDNNRIFRTGRNQNGKQSTHHQLKST